MNIEPYAEHHRQTILDLSVRAWAPVFPLTQAAVPRFVYESFYPHGWKTRQLADLAALLDHEPENADVALEGSTVVGWVCTRRHPEDRMGELYVLAVDPDHQRRGIGSALMHHSLARVRAAGMTMVMVETGDDPGPRAGPRQLRVGRLRALARRALLQAPRLALPLAAGSGPGVGQ